MRLKQTAPANDSQRVAALRQMQLAGRQTLLRITRQIDTIAVSYDPATRCFTIDSRTARSAYQAAGMIGEM